MRIPPPAAQRILVGTTVVSWVLVALTAGWHSLADNTSTPVAAVLIGWGWVLWTSTMVGLFVHSPVSLTLLRVVSPLAVICSVWAGAPLAVFFSMVTWVLTQSSVLADTLVQGGAYGAEQRFALRTPVPYFAPTVVAWAVYCTSVLGGTLLIAAQNFVVGIPVLALGIWLSRSVPKRLHRLARRWLVIVPSGVVVHDHLVLAETMMVQTTKLKSVSVVPEAGETADFTGLVNGPRIAIELREADKVVLSRITAKNLGTTEALHVLSFSVAPRRVASAMAALQR